MFADRCPNVELRNKKDYSAAFNFTTYPVLFVLTFKGTEAE